MVNRVALGKLGDGVTYGLEISKPGVNVLTASQQDMVFSTTWSHAGSVILSGNIAGGGGSTTTVNFGVTLDYVPLALVYFTTGIVGRRARKYVLGSPPFQVTMAEELPVYNIFTDKIEIQPAGVSTDNIRYLILRCPG
jgi:hypothetical protein